MNLRRIGLFALLAAVMMSSVSLAQVEASKNSTIHIKDMHCKHCAKKIASKLFTVRGVLKVSTNLEKGVAIVVPAANAKLSPEELWNVVESIDFEPTKIVGPQGQYIKSPGGGADG